MLDCFEWGGMLACPNLDQLSLVMVNHRQQLTPVAHRMQRPCSAGVLAKTASANANGTYSRIRHGFESRSPRWASYSHLHSITRSHSPHLSRSCFGRSLVPDLGATNRKVIVQVGPFPVGG